MNIQKLDIQVEKTVQVCCLGYLENATTIFVVLHGYGQLPEYFIKKFEPLLNEKTCIIAPEGTSKFYIKGASGRVGSSWMTKHSRESEITDYVKYINSLQDQLNFSDKKVILLGFSQGGATAQRCYQSNTSLYRQLILCSCSINDDFFFDEKTIYIVGDNDEYISKKEIESIRLNTKPLIFEGTHDINIEYIKKGLLF